MSKSPFSPRGSRGRWYLAVILILLLLGTLLPAAAAPATAPIVQAQGLLPATSSTVAVGQVTIGCTVNSAVALQSWQLLIDGAPIPTTISGGPRYELRSTVPVPAGEHRVSVRLTDTSGATGGWNWNFTAGSGPSTTPTPAPSGKLPEIRPLAPPADWLVPSGPVRISALFRTTGDLGANHSISLDGRKLPLEGGGPGPEQETLFGETNVAPGPHTVVATAIDEAGRSNTVTWNFTAAAAEKMGSPILTPVLPLPGVTVQPGAIRIAARAESNSALTSVKLSLDGKPLNAEGGGPSPNQETVFVEVNNLTGGLHVVTVEATDQAGGSNITAWEFYVGGTDGENRRLFRETGYSIKGPFLDYWNSLGTNALQILGYPISGLIVEQLGDGQTYTVQYFERVRLEWHPENVGTEFEVLYGLLGISFHKPDAPVANPGTVPNGQYFPETGHTVRGPLLQKWQSTGGLRVHGYPISEEIKEVSPTDGKTYTVQYFQRARFELHPENAGTAYEVLLGLLGRQLYKQQYPDR